MEEAFGTINFGLSVRLISSSPCNKKQYTIEFKRDNAAWSFYLDRDELKSLRDFFTGIKVK